MKKASWLLALVLPALGAQVRAQDGAPAVQESVQAMPAQACLAQECTTADTGARPGACRRCWEWLTYHPLPSGCACGRQGCKPVCRPDLYTYFLYLHPGCGANAMEPVSAVAGPAQDIPAEAPANDWQRPETLPTPQPAKPAEDDLPESLPAPRAIKPAANGGKP